MVFPKLQKSRAIYEVGTLLVKYQSWKITLTSVLSKNIIKV